MAENLLEIRRSAHAARLWYRSVYRTKPDPRKLLVHCYTVDRKEHVLPTYVEFHYGFPPTRSGHGIFRRGERTIAEGRKAPSTTRGYVRTVQTLIDLLELPGGWNSYNARPIRKENVALAVDLLARLMREGTPAPSVVPKVGGGVQLEWHTHGIDLEISIDSPDEFRFFAEDISDDQDQVEEGTDESVLAKWIDRISG